MRRLLLCLLVLAAAVSLGGCASTLTEEERDFFYRSWLKR